ncbi:hypothetical protein IKG50_00255 [Candidatus Saccharibacteria bacterium]|nr:hypothetical protein [Candidatus Saccharibacteria bacterium]
MKIKIFFATLLASLLIPFASASADDVTSITTLSDFISYKATPGSYRLDADISLVDNTSITASGYILDLNGHTLNVGAKTLLANGVITIKDTSTEQSGKITGTSASPRIIQVGGSGVITLESGTFEGPDTYTLWLIAGAQANLNGGTVTSSEVPAIVNIGTVTVDGATVYSSALDWPTYYGQSSSTLTLNSGTIESAGDYFAVLLSKPGSKFIMNGGLVRAKYIHPTNPGRGGVGLGLFKDTEFIMNGGKIESHAQGIAANGSQSDNAKITINGGEIVSDTIGIYAPQRYGETTITGGTITGGDTALEIRAGKLNISGGVFTGGNGQYYVDPNDNGSAGHNVAISIVQHTTKQPIEVNITGGTFSANLPLIEANPLNNPEEAIEKISIKLGDDASSNRPVFNSTGTKTVVSEDKTNFIYSGLYTHNVTDYVATDHGEIAENSMEAVYPYHEVKNEIPADFPGGTVDVDMTRTLHGSLVTIKATPAPGYYVDEIIVTDANGNRIPIINGNQFYAPNSDVGIHVVFAVKNPATTDDHIDYFAFMGICVAAFICSVSSLLLGKKMATIASRRGE